MGGKSLKNRKKSIWKLSIFLLLMTIGFLLCFSCASADENGTWGNLSWALNSSGTLIISGTGQMNDFDSGEAWLACSDDIQEIIIENGITSIGAYAFEGCYRLTSIAIPDSITSIGENAFAYCDLASITIPVNVTNIGPRAFNYCDNLININVNSGNTAYTSVNGVLFNKPKDTLICYPRGKTSTTFTIPNSVTTIGTAAFGNNSNLKSIIIPDSVTIIEDSAFSNVENLTSITIPNSVTVIADSVFAYNNKLTSITIPYSVISIGDLTFSFCTNLTTINVDSENTAYMSINGVLFNKSKKKIVAYPAGKKDTTYTIPSSVTDIGGGAFGDCSSLSEIIIPEGVKSIGDSAFSDCYSLKSIIIPNNVSRIGISAFNSCHALTKISIPESVISIGSYAFANSGVTNVKVYNPECVFGDDYIWNGIYSIFMGCPDTLRLFGWAGSTAESFANEAGINFIPLAVPDFVLPVDLTAIEAEAFSGVQVSVIYIPDTVVSLGSKAFANCATLQEIHIPASVTSIATDLFDGLTSNQLMNITIYGAPDSAAESFANSKGIDFVRE